MAISALVLLIGVVTEQEYLWLPTTVLAASFIEIYSRDWITSEKLGSAKNTSATIKLLLMLVGMYALVGQFILIALLIYWFI